MDALTKLDQDAVAYLDESHRAKGLGRWRALYRDLLAQAPLAGFGSIAELGAGTPDFLEGVAMKERLAVDVGDRYRAAFEQAGVAFRQANLEKDDVEGWGRFDVVVCSDVFEHLLYPHLVLEKIARLTSSEGFLLSHVPNEYALKKTLKVMAGRRDGLYFHRQETEWTDPHLRRFTDIGFQRFLKLSFQHNIKITQLRYKKTARMISRLGVGAPFLLEPGPTYASTNDPAKAGSLAEAVERLAKAG